MCLSVAVARFQISFPMHWPRGFRPFVLCSGLGRQYSQYVCLDLGGVTGDLVVSMAMSRQCCPHFMFVVCQCWSVCTLGDGIRLSNGLPFPCMLLVAYNYIYIVFVPVFQESSA